MESDSGGISLFKDESNSNVSLGTPEFADWTSNRTHTNWGTNFGSTALPFQGWRHFKEAFAPEIVQRAVMESKVSVQSCFDPFGGSGTTPLASQFLGIHPLVAEVNPYLADLIEAKLDTYNVDLLAKSLGRIMKTSNAMSSIDLSNLPPTFIEPGVNERWIFGQNTAISIGQLMAAIGEESDCRIQRLFRVLLGGILVSTSNVTVNGKGRRYRRHWKEDDGLSGAVRPRFEDAAHRAIQEIHKHGRRPHMGYTIIRGDARAMPETGSYDLAVFSPLSKFV